MPGARDGQLRIRRGTDVPPWTIEIYDDLEAMWRDLHGSGGSGAVRLIGPMTVDYSDIPTDGSTKDLFTPTVGDVLLRLFPDWQAVTQWDQGYLYVGQNIDATGGTRRNVLAVGGLGNLTISYGENLDIIEADNVSDLTDGDGTTRFFTGHVFHTSDPVQIQLARTGGDDPSQGHVELYALIASPVAP